MASTEASQGGEAQGWAREAAFCPSFLSAAHNRSSLAGPHGLLAKEFAEGHLLRSTRSPQESSKGLWGKNGDNKLVRNEEEGTMRWSAR